MIYTPDEKQKMDRLAQAFSGYIAASREIDIAYAEKSGYVRLIVAECADQVFFPLRDYDEMLDTFFFDVISDHVEMELSKNPHCDYSMVDIRRPCEYLRSILHTLDDREYALERLETYIADWKRKYAEA